MVATSRTSTPSLANSTELARSRATDLCKLNPQFDVAEHPRQYSLAIVPARGRELGQMSEQLA